MMEISFYDEDIVDLNDFAKDLVDKIWHYFYEHINIEAFQPVVDYLKDIYPDQRDNISIEIIYNSIKCLQCTVNGEHVYTISFDENKQDPITGAKFISIINLIDQGSLSTPAIPIYSETFEYFNDNLATLYSGYKKRMRSK